jgi:hypothetical protein
VLNRRTLLTTNPGNVMKLISILSGALLLLFVGGCTPLTLKPADFGWPVESVLKVEANGMVQENRYQLSFNVKPMLFEETGDSVAVSNVNIHVIRDPMGYYYLTAAKFKNVYVFAPSEGSLRLENKIMISEKGMSGPAFNARPPHIQLLNGNEKFMLTKSGIQEGEKK